MAINYRFEIHKINALVESQGKENLITKVDYTYSGSEEIEGVIYSDDIGGTQSFEYNEGEDFIPYSDSEDFERVIVGWLDASLDILDFQNRIAEGISKKAVPVENDLYFTWNK